MPSLVLESPVDFWKLRNCPETLSKWMVLSSKISMCLQEEDLITLSSTYAEMLATFGCSLYKTALAQAVTGKLTSIMEKEHPCAKEFVLNHGLPTWPLNLNTLVRFK